MKDFLNRIATAPLPRTALLLAICLTFVSCGANADSANEPVSTLSKTRCDSLSSDGHPFRLVSGTVQKVELAKVNVECAPGSEAVCEREYAKRKPDVVLLPLEGNDFYPNITTGPFMAFVKTTKPDVSLVKMKVGRSYEFCAEYLDIYSKADGSTRFMIHDQAEISEIAGATK